jgi:PAS domain S-box-containing protein
VNTDDAVHRLAVRWAQLAAIDDPRVVSGLNAVLHRLAVVVRAEPFRPGAARAIGAELLDTGFLGPTGRPIRRAENLLGPTLWLLRGAAPDALGIAEAEQRRRLEAAVDDIVTGLIRELQRRGGRSGVEPRRPVGPIIDTRLRAAYEQSPVGWGIAEPSGVLVDLNPALRRMLGIGTTFRPRPITDFVHPDDSADLVDRLRLLLDDEGEPVHIELRMVQRDGIGFWANLVASRVLDDTGKPEFLLLMIDDRARPRTVWSDPVGHRG